MASINLGSLSPLTRAALSLDEDFAELEDLRGQIERLNVDSDVGVDKGRNLLVKFGECGTRIGENIQILARELENSRHSAEKSATTVAEKALQIQRRHEQNETMLGKFQALVAKVNALTSSVAELRKPAGVDFTPEEKAILPVQLSGLDEQLAHLVESMTQLKAEAADCNMKNLERDAHSLAQSMLASRRKLSMFAGQYLNNDSSKPTATA